MFGFGLPTDAQPRIALRTFDSGGYSTFAEAGVDPDSKNFVGCEDGAMFIENVDDNNLTWRCSIVGCHRSRTTAASIS